MIYFVTSNKGKFSEAQKIVPELEMLEMDLPEEQEVDQQKIIEKKLAFVADYLCSAQGRKRIERESGEGSVEFIVEDTGFYIDCLPGLPGPLIKWFLKTIGRQGIYEICKKCVDSVQAWV
jgi:inosine/xanthosine triphosphate pyrophosphatase family protein